MEAIKQHADLREHLLRLLRAHDRKAISSLALADCLGSINDSVHRTPGLTTVGPRSIVAWRYRKQGLFGGGGGQQFYTGTVRDRSSGVLPAIANGQNLSGLIEALGPYHRRFMEAFAAKQPIPTLGSDEANALVANIPSKPDRKLDRGQGAPGPAGWQFAPTGDGVS
jgi:hypothetical protein